jgi:predicted enzyme related to lactoylglutathione lyase
MSGNNSHNDLRIDYVEFPATDIGAIKQFYAGVFGWQFEDYGPEYTAFQDGRLSGGFFLAEKAAAGGPLVVIYASALEAVEQKIKAAGGRIVKDTFSFPGGRRFHFSDPSGNQLAVWSDREPAD